MRSGKGGSRLLARQRPPPTRVGGSHGAVRASGYAARGRRPSNTYVRPVTGQALAHLRDLLARHGIEPSQGNRPVPSGYEHRTRPGARFRRLARRFGKGHEKKAAIAVARTLICIAWAVMARGQDYADAGEDYYDQRYREHLIRHHQQAPGPARLPGHPHPAR